MAEDAVVWVAIAALIGGRALYIVQNQLEQVARDPLSALMIWEGGLSFYGGGNRRAACPGGLRSAAQPAPGTAGRRRGTGGPLWARGSATSVA